MLPMRLF